MALQKGDKVESVRTEEGIPLVPVVPFRELFGVDRDRKDVVRRMVREIQSERRREASEE
jgi:hypothetical protein